MNAQQFVQSLADTLIAQGREVEIEQDDDSFRFYARSRSILEDGIAASAIKSYRTGRWNFTGLRVYPMVGDVIKRQTRSRARTAVKVWGTSDPRISEGVTA